MTVPDFSQHLNMSDSISQTVRNASDKKTLKIAFLESENRNLGQMVDDLQTTLSINKNIIKNLLDHKKQDSTYGSSCGGGMDYTVSQLTHENDLLEVNLRKVTDERD